MKNLLLLLLLSLVVVLSSCATNEQIAQRKIRKALKLDPNAVKKYTTDTLIKGVAKGEAKVVVPEQKGQGEMKPDNDVLEKEKGVEKWNYRDSVITLTVTKKGKEAFADYTVKEKVVYVPVEVPFEVPVKVPGKAINVPVDRPFYVYTWFWILTSYSILITVLFLFGRIIKQSVLTLISKK